MKLNAGTVAGAGISSAGAVADANAGAAVAADDEDAPGSQMNGFSVVLTKPDRLLSQPPFGCSFADDAPSLSALPVPLTCDAAWGCAKCGSPARPSSTASLLSSAPTPFARP